MMESIFLLNKRFVACVLVGYMNHSRFRKTHNDDENQFRLCWCIPTQWLNICCLVARSNPPQPIQHFLGMHRTEDITICMDSLSKYSSEIESIPSLTYIDSVSCCEKGNIRLSKCQIVIWTLVEWMCLLVSYLLWNLASRHNNNCFEFRTVTTDVAKRHSTRIWENIAN